jgi:hypothetical protein
MAEPFDFLTERQTGEGAKSILGTPGEPRRLRKVPMDKTTRLTRNLATSTLLPPNKVDGASEMRLNMGRYYEKGGRR